jgi:hypothetical protein
MSRRPVRRPRLARRGRGARAGRTARVARRLTRRLLRPVLAVVVLVLMRRVAGTVVTSVAAAVVGTLWLVWWWARVVEPWLFAARPPHRSAQLVRPVAEPRPAASERERHVVFAQALAYVATRYLAECEREVGRDPEAQP